MPNKPESTLINRMGTPVVDWWLLNGYVFSTGAYFGSVAAGNAKRLYVENTTNDRYFGIVGQEVRSSGEITVDKAFNVTEDTAGTAPATGITNKRSGNPQTTQATVAIGGDGETGVYSGGESFNDKGSGAGSGGAANPGVIQAAFSNVISPGDNLLLGAENTSSAQLAYLSIDLDWVELPAEEFEG